MKLDLLILKLKWYNTYFIFKSINNFIFIYLKIKKQKNITHVGYFLIKKKKEVINYYYNVLL